MSTSSIFSGSSRFSNDFGQVIERTLAIASLPIKQYSQQKATLDTQTAALTSLKTKVSTLQSAVKDLSSAFGAASYKATNTNKTAASVTLGASPISGSWDMKITELGSPTSFVVSGFPSVSDPASSIYTSAATQTLLVDLDPLDGLANPEMITLSPVGQTLQSVVDEINKKAGNLVTAAMVNVGTSSNPNYQLSLQSRALGPVDITYEDGAIQSTNSALQRGVPAAYTVNGTELTNDSRTVLLAPGVTVELDTTTSSSFTITSGQSSTALSDALGKFVTAFNAVEGELDKHRGKDAPLSGNSILNTTQSALRKLLSGLSSSGSFNGLEDIGVGYNSTKDLHLDTDVFKTMTEGKFAELQTFFGDEDSGFLAAADRLFSSLVETGTGVIASAITTTEAASAASQKRIDSAQDRVDRLEQNLLARMADADATIAMLEQQVSYFGGMWEAMRTAAKAANQ